MVVDVLRMVAAATRAEPEALPARTRQQLETWAAALFLVALVLIGAFLPYL